MYWLRRTWSVGYTVAHLVHCDATSVAVDELVVVVVNVAVTHTAAIARPRNLQIHQWMHSCATHHHTANYLKKGATKRTDLWPMSANNPDLYWSVSPAAHSLPWLTCN